MSLQNTLLADGITPPVEVLAVTVDGTSRSYDLTTVNANGHAYNAAETDRVYMTLRADGGDVYYALSLASRTIAEATVIAAGGALAYNDVYCMVVPDGSEVSFLIRRNKHKFLTLKGSGTARFYFSSENTAQKRG